MRLRHGIAAALLAASLAACGNLGMGGSAPSRTSSGAAGVGQPPVPVPKVVIRTPKRASFLSPGQVAVEGVVTPAGAPIQTVLLMGQPVTIDANGVFRGFATLGTGLTVIEVSAQDTAGKLGGATIGVLAGTFTPIAQPVPEAAGARVNAAALDAIGKIIEGAIYSTDFTKLLMSHGPFKATSFLFLSLDATVTQVRYASVHVGLVPTAQGIDVTAEVDGIVLDCDAVIDYGLGKLSPTPTNLEADKGTVNGTIRFDAQPDGSVKSTISNATCVFQNFRATATGGLIGTVIPLFQSVVENGVRDAILNAINNVAPPHLDSIIKDGLQPAPINILGKFWAPQVLAETLVYDGQGVTAEVGFQGVMGSQTALGAAAPGALTTPGSMPQLTTTRGFYAAVDDDALNRMLFTMWAAGALDITMDAGFFAQQNVTLPITLNVGAIKTFVPEVTGLIPDTAPIMLKLEAALPPIVEVTGRPDIVTAHAGEVGLDILVDRGNGWERLVKAVAQVDLGLDLSLSPQGLQISTVGTPTIRSDVVDEPIVALNDRHLEVLLDVVLTPTLPKLLNSTKVIPIPQFNQLSTLNVGLFPAGPNHEHLGIEGDLTR